MNADHAVPLNLSPERVVAPDDDIVSAAQAGSPAAFAELHALYSRRLYKTIFAITKNPEDAEDALQETFLRAHVALRTFQGRSNVHTWLTRIAINSALMILRRRRARPEILFSPHPDPDAGASYFQVKDSAPNPEETYGVRQRRLKMLRAIRSLAPHLRKPIQLQATRGSSVSEIGRALDISNAAVKSRLYRARRRVSAMCNPKHFSTQRYDSHSAIARSGALSAVFERPRMSRGINRISDSE